MTDWFAWRRKEEKVRSSKTNMLLLFFHSSKPRKAENIPLPLKDHLGACPMMVVTLQLITTLVYSQPHFFAQQWYHHLTSHTITSLCSSKSAQIWCCLILILMSVYNQNMTACIKPLKTFSNLSQMEENCITLWLHFIF